MKNRKQKIQEIFEGFIAMQKAMATRKADFLQQHGLTKQQMHILYALAHGNQLTVKEIAAKMGVTSSAATQIIEGLVNADYVERKHDDKDRRIVNIYFSEKGRKQFEKCKNAHMARMGVIFEILSDAELDLLISIPEKVLNNLKDS